MPRSKGAIAQVPKSRRADDQAAMILHMPNQELVSLLATYIHSRNVKRTFHLMAGPNNKQAAFCNVLLDRNPYSCLGLDIRNNQHLDS